MMGPRQVAQGSLFYEFSLEDHVPPEGRPSVDPELMIRMLIVGYCFGIRSERRLREVHLNLAYRWFCRPDLTDRVPDHSTFSKNRHGRFRQSDLFRHLFESVVARCIAEGLVGGTSFASDASLIQADANKQYSAPKERWDPALIDTEIAPRAVLEYLDVLDDAAFGAASDVAPKFVAYAGPASQWTGALKGPAFFAYSDNYLIDTENAVILDVEATRSIRQAELGATRTMIERTRDPFGLVPERLAADAAYGSGEMLGWLVDEQKIEPHIPVLDKSERPDGTFSNAEFSFDAEADEYTCPAGTRLKKYRRQMKKPRTGITKDDFRRYYARKQDCTACALKPAARRTRTPGRSRGISSSTPATGRARSPRPTPTLKVPVGGRRSRCSSPISSASSASTACAFADRTGRKTIPPRRHRTEPPEARQTGPGTAHPDVTAGIKQLRQIHRRPHQREFFNTIGPKPTLARTSVAQQQERSFVQLAASDELAPAVRSVTLRPASLARRQNAAARRVYDGMA